MRTHSKTFPSLPMGMMGGFRTAVVIFALISLISFILGYFGVFDFAKIGSGVFFFIIGFLISKLFYEAFRDWVTYFFVILGLVFVISFFVDTTFMTAVVMFALGFIVSREAEKWEGVKHW